MLIVGGKSSANTKRLYEVCKKMLGGSYLVETEKDIKDAWFKGVGSVGITSGASTPDRVVEKVVKRVETKVKLRINPTLRLEKFPERSRNSLGVSEGKSKGKEGCKR
jgi:4-hydroxy-3-methylbut-2-enyl diphosphate reductase IspH